MDPGHLTFFHMTESCNFQNLLDFGFPETFQKNYSTLRTKIDPGSISVPEGATDYTDI